MLWLMNMPVTPCAFRPFTKPMTLLVSLTDKMIGGFVENEHLGLEMHGAGDGHALALTAGEFADQGIGRAQMKIDIGDGFDALPRHALLIHDADAAERTAVARGR